MKMNKKENLYINNLPKQLDRECLTSVLFYVRHRDEFSRYRTECILFQIFGRRDAIFYKTVIDALDGMHRRSKIESIRDNLGNTLHGLVNAETNNKSKIK
jgi:hypothetical protein